MFTEPIVITVNTVPISLARVSLINDKNQTGSNYSTSDELWKTFLSHQAASNNRKRSLVRFENRKIVTNPLDSTNDYDFLGIQVVFDRPLYGFSVTEMQNQWAGFKAWLDNAALTKIYGGES